MLLSPILKLRSLQDGGFQNLGDLAVGHLVDQGVEKHLHFSRLPVPIRPELLGSYVVGNPIDRGPDSRFRLELKDQVLLSSARAK
jgi:hypothetical protein